jgi:hypothetical protein
MINVPWLAILAVSLAPVLAHGAPAARDTETAVARAREFLTHLEQGHLREAYSLTSRGFQADLSETDFLALAMTPPSVKETLRRSNSTRGPAAIRALVRVVAVGEAQVEGAIGQVLFLEIPASGEGSPNNGLPRVPLNSDVLDAMERNIRRSFTAYASEVSGAEIDDAVRWARRALAEQRVKEIVRGTIPRLNYLHLVKQEDGWKVVPFMRIRRRLQPDPGTPGKAIVDYRVQFIFHPPLLRRPPTRLHLVIYEVEPERCRRCGDSLAASWNFCPSCGTPRRRPPVDPPSVRTTLARQSHSTAGGRVRFRIVGGGGSGGVGARELPQ